MYKASGASKGTVCQQTGLNRYQGLPDMVSGNNIFVGPPLHKLIYTMFQISCSVATQIYYERSMITSSTHVLLDIKSIYFNNVMKSFTAHVYIYFPHISYTFYINPCLHKRKSGTSSNNTFNFLAAAVDLELDPTTPPSASFCVLELEQLA